jgi:hypothetical protein
MAPVLNLRHIYKRQAIFFLSAFSFKVGKSTIQPYTKNIFFEKSKNPELKVDCKMKKLPIFFIFVD